MAAKVIFALTFCGSTLILSERPGCRNCLLAGGSRMLGNPRRNQ